MELGCGCGGALLPAAFRMPGMRFTGVEIDPEMASLAEAGVAANGFQDRVTIETGEASDWVKPYQNRFDLVFANPPYFESGKISPPGEGKSSAYIESLDVSGWVKAMVFAAKPRAPVVLIHRAAELARILTAGKGAERAEARTAPPACPDAYACRRREPVGRGPGGGGRGGSRVVNGGGKGAVRVWPVRFATPAERPEP